jgi:N-acetylmuramoyl-L-alanine amidase
MTRTDNTGWGPCIDERGKFPQSVGAAVMVSIHADGGPKSGRGFHIIYPDESNARSKEVAESSFEMAKQMRAALIKMGFAPSDYIGDKGLDKRHDLGTLNWSSVPAIIIECGNMANAKDAAILSSDDGKQRLAEAIVAALI